MTFLDRWTPLELGDRRVLHPGPLRWLRAAGWTVALFFLITLAAFPAIETLEDVLPGGPEIAGFLANCIGAVIALGAYALLVKLGEARTPSELALKPAVVETTAGLLIGFAMIAAVMGLLLGLNLYQITWTGPASAWSGAGLAVQSGVVEEILLRAIMLRLMWRAFGPWAAFIISAAVFGAAHLANPEATWFAAACIALEAGVMLAAFYALTGRIWVSIGAHAGWNFTMGYLFGAPVSGTDFGPSLATSAARFGFPDWLSGGEFGPEASLPGLLVCTAVGLAALWWAWKLGRFARPAASA